MQFILVFKARILPKFPERPHNGIHTGFPCILRTILITCWSPRHYDILPCRAFGYQLNDKPQPANGSHKNSRQFARISG